VNHYECDKRTDNDLEGYNSRLSRLCDKKPNIWTFIHHIKKEESSQTLKFIRPNDEKFKKRGRNKKDVDRDLAIEKFKVLYILGSCPVYELQKQIDAEFLSNLASLTKNFFN
jgi:hypothetical protein